MLKLGKGLLLLCAVLGTHDSSAQMGGFSQFQLESMRTRDRANRRLVETYKRKKENGENLDGYHRTQDMGHFSLINGAYKLDYVYSGGTSPETGETIYYEGELETKVSGMAYGVGGERFFPLSKTGENSMLALSIGVDVHFIKLKTNELRLNGGQRFTPDISIVQTNFPVSILYKSGTDAVLRKSSKSGFAFGGGALAGFNADLLGFAPTNFYFRPYALAEISFYTWICWKMRVTGYPGKINLIKGPQNVGVGGSMNESVMSVQSNSTIMFSLILPMHSRDWDDY